MTITIFGANGKVGSKVVENALDKGYKVHAAVYGAHRLPNDKNLTVFQCNIYDRESVALAIEGADAVISALGSWGTPKKDILSEGMKNIIPAMQAAGIKRIISLTGADARASGDKPCPLSVLTRMMLVIIAPKILHDGEAHIKLLEKSELDYTVLRSPVMSERGGTNYDLKFSLPKPWQTIHREAVANCMVELLKKPNLSRKCPVIYRSS